MIERRSSDLIPGSGLDHLLTAVHSYLGVDFRKYRTGTLERRLSTRLKVTGCGDYIQYLDYLHKEPKEFEKLLDVLTVNVTQFFRDVTTFEAIEQRILPMLIQSARERKADVLNIWSAGSSSGEEAYSLAILADELLGGDRRLRVRIIGTDIDSPSLEKARKGIYSAQSIQNVALHRRSCYFTEVGDQYHIADILKQRTVFLRQSLLQPTQLPQMDLILCRNVAIYFTPALQKDLYRELCNHLQPWGCMILGKVESLWGPSRDWFTPIDNRERIYQKR